MIIDSLVQLVGPIPAGCEMLAFVVGSVFAFYMVGCVFTLIGKIFKNV